MLYRFELKDLSPSLRAILWGLDFPEISTSQQIGFDPSRSN
jgi:hypothetical protein